MHICTVTVALTFNILLFLFSLHPTLSFSLWSNSHLTLSFPPLIFAALSSLATVVPPPITSLAVAHADRHCFRQSPLLSFFFV